MNNDMPLDRKKMYKYPLIDAPVVNDIRELLERSVKKFPERAAYHIKDPIALRELDPRSEEAQNYKVNPKDPYRTVTYSQVQQDRLALGTALHELGLKPEDKVLILAETRYEWYISYLAVVCGLSIIAPIDKELPIHELETVINRSGATTIFFSREQESKLIEIKDKIPSVERFISYDLPSEKTEALTENQELYFFWDMLESGNKLRAEGHKDYDSLPIDPDAFNILIFTSGTTAKSKAVMLSHRNITSDIVDLRRLIYFDENDSLLSILPLHHTFEATTAFLLPLYAGASVAINDGLRHIPLNMKQAKVTALIMVPLVAESIVRVIHRFVDKDPKLKKKFNFGTKLSKFLLKIGIDARKKIFKTIHDNFGGKLRLLVVGGAPLNPEVVKDLTSWGFPTLQGYGVTESSPVMAVNREFYFEPASCGLPLPSGEIRIINKDENGIGEIIGRGPSIMLGYYNDPELTKEALDAEGFYHTGDYGYMDDRGFVYITGRKANVIVTKNGKNIFPEEIEQLLIQIDPIIAEVVVYGSDEGRNGDKLLTAEVYPNQTVIDEDPELKGEELCSPTVEARIQKAIDAANNKLENYKKIKALELRNKPFPKNTTKKIIRERNRKN